MQSACAVIIVTHNSQKVIGNCIAAIFAQTLPLYQIIIVDSGSDNIDYLKEYQALENVTVVAQPNIGFSRANNLGLGYLDDKVEHVMFINPDLFLFAEFHETLQACFAEKGNETVLTGKLLGYDIVSQAPTGLLDSTGIFRKWFGRWYDRGQGTKDAGQYDTAQSVPAICGALLCVSKSTLAGLDMQPFNEGFFMYKEDIELSLRLRKMGYELVYSPDLQAYHCRGWQNERKNMPMALRETAALNEVKMYKIHPSPYILWALIKYLLVKLFKI